MADTSGDESAEGSSPGEDLLEEYLKTLRRRHTRLGYKGDLKAFFGEKPITEEKVRRVTWVDIEEHEDNLRGEGKSPATVRRRLAALRSFYEWLQERGVVSQSPFDSEGRSGISPRG